MQKERRAQEELYRFPYHYIIHFDTNGYKSFSQYKNRPYGYRYAGYLIRVLEEVACCDFSSLVDVGCGDGFFLKKLCEKYPSKELAGVDLCERAISFARLLNNVGDNGKGNVEFLCQDIAHEPLAREFDIATSIHVLEHIPPESLDDFLAATWKMIKEGGKFIVLVPSTNISKKRSTRHYQHFDEQSLTDLLSKHFKVERVEYLNNDRFWGKIISRLFTNKMFILNNDCLKEWLFKLYLRRFLRCSQPNGYTLLAVCKKE